MPSRNPPPGKTKITINLEPDLKRRLKVAAAKCDVYFQDALIQAAEEWLTRKGGNGGT